MRGEHSRMGVGNKNLRLAEEHADNVAEGNDRCSKEEKEQSNDAVVGAGEDSRIGGVEAAAMMDTMMAMTANTIPYVMNLHRHQTHRQSERHSTHTKWIGGGLCVD